VTNSRVPGLSDACLPEHRAYSMEWPRRSHPLRDDNSAWTRLSQRQGRHRPCKHCLPIIQRHRLMRHSDVLEAMSRDGAIGVPTAGYGIDPNGPTQYVTSMALG
jgi:hypothetical protein